MSRIKTAPYSEDFKALRKYLKSVSWGDECILCTLLDGSAAYILVPNLYVLCPCTWENYDAFKSTMMERANIHGVKPGVIITNEADPKECERIWWDSSMNSIIVMWLSAKNKIQNIKLTKQSMEGLDWKRTLHMISSEGVPTQPVMD